MVLFLTSVLRTDKALKVSVIHRVMEDDWRELSVQLGVKAKRCVSYTQLKRILASIDIESFNAINEAYFGSTVVQQGPCWKSADGKELRGSIDGAAGQTRGQSVVSLTEHQTGHSSVIGYYDGAKESEKPVVTGHFEQAGPLMDKFTLDALHTCPRNMALIDQRGGTYLMQVKGNQALLVEDCELIHQHLPSECHGEQSEKGHGRVETRRAWGYGLRGAGLEARWGEAGLATLLVVERVRYNTKTHRQSCQTAYWVSNQALDGEGFADLCQAARGHWAVEARHYVRDVQMGEDKMLISNPKEARVMAGFVTTATNLLARQGQNISQLRERLTRKPALVHTLFKRN